MKLLKRIIAILPAVILQIAWLIVLLSWLSPYSGAIQFALSLIAIVVVLFVITQENDSTYKFLWLLVILPLPILGTALYLAFGNKRTTRPLKRRLNAGEQLPNITLPKSTADTISNPRVRKLFANLESTSGYPTTAAEGMKFYPLGDDALSDMLDALRSAKRYIFMEYFIIEHGQFWDSIVEILAEKVTDGVDVRVLYDDFGCIQTLSKAEVRAVRAKGINLQAFNEMRLVSGTLNYRNHRKILVVDGRIAFSGGINLADEYINTIVKHGHWKDLVFRLEGQAALPYTHMFVQFWNAFTKDPVPETLLLPAAEDAFEADSVQPNPMKAESAAASQGVVLSYYDSPISATNISNELFIELLRQAEHTAYFYSPYLMLGDSLLEAFQRAARRGVDVRIYMPHICDGPIIGRMGRAFYQPLLSAGVRIFEYTPGFVHAKASLIDDEIGTIGTVNLDYRSLFLHFENNSLMYKAEILNDLSQDMKQVEGMSEEIIEGKNFKRGYAGWFLDGILRILAPLC